MRAAALGIAALALAGCAAVPRSAPPSRAAAAPVPLPPVKVFTRAQPQPPQRANADIARDFLDLHFQLEGGSPLPVFTRFEMPITLRVTGHPLPGFTRDLAALLARLEREAGIPIRRTASPGASITVELVPRREIRRALPNAACFVVPNAASLAEYRRARRHPRSSWPLLRERKQLAIFLPNDASLQEARDCLHEELAQAIGPLNDLYRLPDSVFNDDNIHVVLTGFDMLVLRATYAPELHTGMTRDQVAARLPAILARLNPAGERRQAQFLPETAPAWADAFERALGAKSALRERSRAAVQAAAIARDLGWQDHRRAHSHFLLGRMLQFQDPALALRHFQSALAFLGTGPETAMHRARVSVPLAAYAIAHGDGATALTLLEPAARLAEAHENAALLATLLMLKAEALALEGEAVAARRVRLDSLGWARYGFGPDWAVEARVREIASLRPPSR
ncbi:DUF2927 domain-containing protein [Cribrihabitans pelagius]|uniref:DUF2927 domain-containing protein n=1 Tax=Cribrihabitans pelagius TaxID=1765746 RepID=UPI003B5CFE35